jgi:hypothetical protein
VLEAVELPAGIADLDTGLADVDADHLTHGCCCKLGKGLKKALGCKKKQGRACDGPRTCRNEEFFSRPGVLNFLENGFFDRRIPAETQRSCNPAAVIYVA